MQFLLFRPIKEKVKNPMGSNAESVSREVQIKEQNHEYFKLYDQLKEHLSETDQIAILEANEQFLPEDNTEVRVCLRCNYSDAHRNCISK